MSFRDGLYNRLHIRSYTVRYCKILYLCISNPETLKDPKWIPSSRSPERGPPRSDEVGIWRNVQIGVAETCGGKRRRHLEN